MMSIKLSFIKQNTECAYHWDPADHRPYASISVDSSLLLEAATLNGEVPV